MMNRLVFDMEISVPADDKSEKSEQALAGPSFAKLEPRPGYGFANYNTVFKAREESAEMTLETVLERVRREGLAGGILISTSNDAVSRAIQAFDDIPGDYFGFAKLNPYDGMRGVEELERLVREEGFKGFSVGPLYSQLEVSHRKYYPFYAKCVELNIPVRLYTAMSYANDRPYDLAHPRYIDTVAVDFPELRIIAGLAGWPWVPDMMALVRRHPNLYLDTAAHRPRHFAKPGSGWEHLLGQGSTVASDKIAVGLSTYLLGMSAEQVVAEYEELGVPQKVLHKWFYENAARIFDLDVS